MTTGSLAPTRLLPRIFGRINLRAWIVPGQFVILRRQCLDSRDYSDGRWGRGRLGKGSY